MLKEDLERLSKFRLMDDDFLSKVFDQNVEAAQLLLNIVLERTDIKVLSVEAQREFKTTIGHSVRFDIYAEDENGKPYDIEIQRADRGASPQRARYNNAVLDTYLLEKGKDYTTLTETYVIFITENDVFGKGMPLYHIERTIMETNELFDDGSHIIFVNGQYSSTDDDIGKLMHDFRCTDADEMFYDKLAEKVRYFKETEGGSDAMCKMMEDMRNEAAAKAAAEATAKTTAEFLAETAKKDAEKAKKMLKDNLSVDKVVEYSGLSLDEVEKLKQEMCS